MSKIKLPKLGILSFLKDKAPDLIGDGAELALSVATGGISDKVIGAFKKKVKEHPKLSESDKALFDEFLEADLEALKIANEDVADARDTEVELIKAGTNEAKWGLFFRYSVAYIMLLGFFMVFYVLLTKEIPASNKSAVDIMVGFLTGTGVGMVLSYIFGNTQKFMSGSLLEKIKRK